jgi:peptidoglycan/xylan/chitin deacetylase (PgdA/CDA1 family)
MPSLTPGLYILNYHDVSFECSVLTRGLGYHHSPDVFAAHVDALSRAGDLVRLDEGIRRLQQGGSFSRPTFAFWFDDGFAGTRRFALPILEGYGITAGLSICSRFVLRQEMYWRCMLSALRFADGLGALRTRLRRFGYRPQDSLKDWIDGNFTAGVLDVLHATYEGIVPEPFRRDAFRAFDDENGIRELAAAGWLIANHTAAHYPVSESFGAEFVRDQFSECQRLIRRIQDGPAFLVVPFGCAYPTPTPPSFYHRLDLEGAVVDVGNRVNTPASYAADRVISRMSAVWRSAKRFPIET